jgi:hypothetical protein
MSDHKVLRAILVVLTLIGLGYVAWALWGDKIER